MSDWLMIGITAVYALLTFFIWRANKNSVKEMKLARQETVLAREEMVIARELAYRPEIIAFFYEKQGGLYFQIKNIGTRVAFDTVVKINPIFNMYTYIHENNFMTVHSGQGFNTYEEKEIKVLAPNQYLETFVGVQSEIVNAYYKSVEENIENKGSLDAKIDLSYYSYGKKEKFKEDYDVTLLDYQSHKGIRIYGVHEGVKELDKINKNLSEIKTELKKVKTF